MKGVILMNKEDIIKICADSNKEIIDKLLPQLRENISSTLKDFANPDGKVSAIDASSALTIFTIETLIKFNKEFVTSVLIKTLGDD
jgi:hypothetical protein